MYFTIFPCFVCLVLCCQFYLMYVEAIRGEKLKIVENYVLPFVVSIGSRNFEKQADENHFCTGVLISKKHVLTAAHCLDFLVRDDIQVVLGSVDLQTAKRYDVLTWITFDQWATIKRENLTFTTNDIAVLTLSKSIRLAKIKQVKLSPLNNRQVERTEAIVAGFGTANCGMASRFLLAGHVQILAKEKCEDMVRKYTNIILKLPPRNLCSAADPYILTGDGDSGGPLLNVNHELVGINLGTLSKSSWYQLREDNTDEFLKKYQVNFHINVDTYRDFINDFMNQTS